MFNFRIRPSKARFTKNTTTPLPPQKNNVEVRPEHFCYLLNILNNTVSESLAKVLSLSPPPQKGSLYRCGHSLGLSSLVPSSAPRQRL